MDQRKRALPNTKGSDFYVYGLFGAEPRPFYIGKGQGGRKEESARQRGGTPRILASGMDWYESLRVERWFIMLFGYENLQNAQFPPKPPVYRRWVGKAQMEEEAARITRIELRQKANGRCLWTGTLRLIVNDQFIAELPKCYVSREDAFRALKFLATRERILEAIYLAHYRAVAK